jgi:cytochrome bd-type quinol oxidase subunit 1
MVNLGALDLSKLQFPFTVSFHIVFPAMSIGLASFLAVRWWGRDSGYHPHRYDRRVSGLQR